MKIMPLYKGNTLIVGGGKWYQSFPNWVAREIKANITVHTATKYGYVLFRNKQYTDSIEGKINGVELFHQHGSGGHFEDWNCGLFPVSPGTTYQLTGSGGEVSFIPAIGN